MGRARSKSWDWAFWPSVLTFVAIVLFAYHLAFGSMEHPPFHPPLGGDGDWALLGYMLGLPAVCGLLAVVVISAVSIRWAGRSRGFDEVDDPDA